MYKCTYVYVRFVIGLLLLWSWLIKRSWLDLAFLRFLQSLFLRLWPASMLICVICCLHTCRLKNPSRSFNCLIFMKQEPLFIPPHLTILLIGNGLVLREVLWFASPGTGGVALRLSPSTATRTAAPRFGSYCAAARPTSWPKHPREDGKRRASSPSAASSSSGSKSCRS